MLPIPEFDEFHTVSDLHMGGEAGFQIFNQGPPLAALINSLCDRPPADSRVALLINGDMVDFLAARNPRSFDPTGAIAKLDDIWKEQAFAPVFAALQRFVSRPNRYLIITLGNHDIELALPWVRAHLLAKLSGGDDAVRGRITLSFEGAGYACSVGGASILCLHGNEVDPWNVTDFETLRRQGRDGVQDRPLDEWTPNAGTKMVIDVMNGVKRKFAFVDLLKPEKEAVVPVLLALDQAQASKLAKIVAVASHLTWDRVRLATGFLSAGEEAESGSVALDNQADPTSALDRLLHQTFRPPGIGPGAAGPEQLLDRVETLLDENADPLHMLEADQVAEQLGMVGAAWDWIRRKPEIEVLLEALESVKQDHSFVVDAPDDTYKRIDEWVGSGFDFVIAGHTHLERCIRRGSGRGTYFNSGTWVALMRLKDEMLSSPAAFQPVFDQIKSSSTVAALGDLVEYRPAVVSIRREEGQVRGFLERVQFDGGNLALTRLAAS